MNVLVACEYSGVVRDAFTRKGHYAVSCDFLDSEKPGMHYKGNVLDILYSYHWDLLIGHPECTYVCNSSAKHLYIDMKKENGINQERWNNMIKGAEFFKTLWNAPVEKICLENPIMLGHAKKLIGIKQSQIIQPWMFGHGETKATCLWLKGLSLLQPTNIVEGREQRIHKMGPSPDRWKERSRTFEGIGDAFAEQWG